MFVFVFVYIKKYNLQTEKRKLNCRDYFSHFVILLVLKVCFSLVTQKLMINCTPRNQSNRWNFPTVMITFVISTTIWIRTKIDKSLKLHQMLYCWLDKFSHFFPATKIMYLHLFWWITLPAFCPLSTPLFLTKKQWLSWKVQQISF